MLGLFKKNKKKVFKANCELSKEPLEKGSGYVITTAQLISSRKFWDHKMTEPETMSYTVTHFKNADPTSKNMRQMIFKKFSQFDKPWIISESYGHLFDIDHAEANALAREWWEREGDFVPEGADSSIQKMDDSTYAEIESYAVMEAGRTRIAV